MASQLGKQRLLDQVEEEIRNRLSGDQAERVVEFAHQIYATFTVEDLTEHQLSDLCGAAMASWTYIQTKPAATAKVRIFNPEYQQHGWQSTHSVVAILCRNMPFITDSVRGELNRRNITVHTINSSILTVVRDKQQKLVELLPARSVIKPPKGCSLQEESLLYLEVARHSEQAEMDAIAETLEAILEEVAIVGDDFHAMVERSKVALVDVASASGLKDKTIEEVQDFVDWLANRHFTFLGYEELQVEYNGENAKVKKVKGSELGLLRSRNSFSEDELIREISRADTLAKRLDMQLVFSKSSARSRIHRMVYPDYVSIKRYDNEGRIVGEHRFLGLYTSTAYTVSPNAIPVIRHKVAEVMDRSGLDLKSHEARDLARVLSVYPRDELFQSHVDILYETAMAINKIQERRKIRLFIRRGYFGKFVNCMVYVPRDIYRTELRLKIQTLLCDAVGASEVEFTTFFSESILTRTHFVLRVDSDDVRGIDVKALEEELIKVTMSWQDHFKNHILEEFGEEQGIKVAENYADAFAPGYMADFDPRAAVNDVAKISELDSADDIAMSLYRVFGEAENELRFRLFHLDGPLPLSDVMPILENLGLRVISECPYGINCKDGKKVWVHDYSLLFSMSEKIDIKNVGEIFQEAFSRIWYGDAESDGFNKLILGAQFGWRQIAMLRAYAHYMKQIQFNFSTEYIAETLCSHMSIAGQIVDLFSLCFDPAISDDDQQRKDQEKAAEKKIIECLDSVENLGQDRIIREYLTLIMATLRTNYYQRDNLGELKTYFSFKLFPNAIPNVPLPKPMYEVFVYSPKVEGVHLRGGKVARGGLRWSDRNEDFRTEVLGLVKAQQVKNAVIVPTGAKGGFIAKQLPTEGGREAFMAEGIRCYQTFIQGLLDITDNLKEDAVIPPADVVRKDEDDTYLVVAADKGTATFSDIANEISHRYEFWLGDAFASGGSVGYDHKKMGITAKGCWVSVQRHFREMGVNIQQEDFTVVGIGDMAGDVFGNGMLLSEHIQLVAAFNHQHIFIDPNPDSAASFVERQRLFELPRSSWGDYQEDLISAGGGIFKRSAKSITLTPEVKARFDIKADKMTPAELINAILISPVDLLWNGGIGTYIKSSQETHADVGDKANDILRVDGNQLRCKVLGEGGNLGATQLGRVEFALNGGKSNTDFIDNAAGVDCSDHEVNIKILLNGVVTSGDMTEKQRVNFLESMTDNISNQVLENNYRQTQAISLAEREAVRRNGEYRRLIQGMEASGRLNRALEFIPEDDVLVERRAAGKGLTRPELSVLISYTKSQLKEELIDSPIPDDEYMAKAVETAFPQRLRDEYNDLIHEHRLRREIIATQVANDLVNYMGITFVDRVGQSTGASSAEVVSAYIAARDVFDLPYYWQQIEALDYKVSADVQMELMASLMRLVRRSSRWFIRNRRSTLNPAAEIATFKDQIKSLSPKLSDSVGGDLHEDWLRRYQYFLDEGVPESLASYVASEKKLYPLLGIIEAAGSISAPALKVLDVFFSLGEQLELDWFAKQIAELKIDNHWQALARESYRDDLEWQLRTLTVGAMRHLCSKGDVAACIDRWMDQQSLLVERWRALLTELQGSETHDFAMYSVAIRELLDMAQRSKFEEVEA